MRGGEHTYTKRVAPMSLPYSIHSAHQSRSAPDSEETEQVYDDAPSVLSASGFQRAGSGGGTEPQPPHPCVPAAVAML